MGMKKRDSGKKEKRKKIIVALLVLVVLILAFCFATLGLYFSMIMNIITGTLWLLLLVQTVVYGKGR